MCKRGTIGKVALNPIAHHHSSTGIHVGEIRLSVRCSGKHDLQRLQAALANRMSMTETRATHGNGTGNEKLRKPRHWAFRIESVNMRIEEKFMWLIVC